MSFDWLTYLALAEYMNENVSKFPEEEACYRSVVSRAYYSVYCLTRNYIRDSDNVTFSSNDHQALQDYLIQHSHKPRKKLGKQLRDLHQHRKKADYDDDLIEQPVNKASIALTYAKKIARGLAELSERSRPP
jgi:uncharacterized protein (UPF0332 family)